MDSQENVAVSMLLAQAYISKDSFRDAHAEFVCKQHILHLCYIPWCARDLTTVCHLFYADTAIKDNMLFSGLPSAGLAAIIDSMQPQMIMAGKDIIKQVL